MTGTTLLTLYHAPDNASLIVRMLLEELGLPYTTVLVDRSKNDQSSSEYRKLSPDGLIPVCVINGHPVIETAAIMLSLADQHNQFTVAATHSRRAEFLKWLFYLSNSLHSDLRLLFYPEKFVGDNRTAVESLHQLTCQRIDKRLQLFDKQYAASPDTYLFGSQPSIIDFYLGACMRWTQLFPIGSDNLFNPADYESIEKMLGSLQARQAVIAACNYDGISGSFFTRAEHARPSQGSVL